MLGIDVICEPYAIVAEEELNAVLHHLLGMIIAF